MLLKAPLTVLVNRPCFVEAHIWTSYRGWILRTYLSVRLEQSDPWLAPVWEMLEKYCFRVIMEKFGRDPMMMGYQAKETIYEVYDSCPSMGHRCVQEPSPVIVGKVMVA